MFDIFPVVKNQKGELERDLLIKNITDLKKFLKRSVRKVMFSEAWIGRWDLFSYEVYRRSDWWWCLLVVNDIIDPFDPNLIGSVMIVPNYKDIWEFTILKK